MERIGLVIADFELRYTTTFKSVAEDFYGVKFTNSHVKHIKEKLHKLKENIQSGHYTHKSRGYDPTIEDVEHIENLLTELVNRYKQAFPLTAHPNPKIYDLLHHLREHELPDPKQIAKEALKETLNPTPDKPKKQTRKQRIEAAAKLKSMERSLFTIHVISNKKPK